MKSGPDISMVASLVGDPARANMLTALMSGRALTASELAQEAGITPQTASSHLAKLEAGGLIEPEKQGRHRYYRLTGSDVAQVLEGLAGLAARAGHMRVRTGPKDPALRRARICYDHLAGRSGVALHDGLVARAWLVPEPGGYVLTDAGRDGLLAWGVDVAAADAAKRAFARPCLDWTERREHLAGALAAAITSALVDGPEPWFVRRADDHRGLRPTELGRTRLADLGWEPAADRRTA